MIQVKPHDPYRKNNTYLSCGKVIVCMWGVSTQVKSLTGCAQTITGSNKT